MQRLPGASTPMAPLPGRAVDRASGGHGPSIATTSEVPLNSARRQQVVAKVREVVDFAVTAARAMIQCHFQDR
jgi:hypothetical protein